MVGTAILLIVRGDLSGQVRILGLDPLTDRHRLHQRIGVQLQESQLQEKLKVREALELYASFYPNPADWRELLERWGLAGKADSRFARLSGGQKQRLFIALALIGNPEVVFLDELTAGLDPGARRATWDLIRAVRAQGVTADKRVICYCGGGISATVIGDGETLTYGELDARDLDARAVLEPADGGEIGIHHVAPVAQEIDAAELDRHPSERDQADEQIVGLLDVGDDGGVDAAKGTVSCK